eukprot:g30184.t1
MPALVSCTIPAAWGWLNRELELSTVPHGGMSMREWHGWVGSVITLSMACRVFIPQAWQVISFRGGLCTFRISQSLCKCRANT